MKEMEKIILVAYCISDLMAGNHVFFHKKLIPFQEAE